MRQFCPHCDDLCSVEKVSAKELFPIKKDELEIVAQLYECQDCKKTFVDDKLEEFNYQLAVEYYRKKHRLLFPFQIAELRQKYSLSQRQLSRLLGWGETTVCQYENGKIQDRAHNDELDLLKTPSNMRSVFEKNRHFLKTDEAFKIEKQIAALVEQELEEFEETRLTSMHSVSVDSDVSGNVPFDLKRFVSISLYILSKESVFKTKLMKLLFYSDFLHFKLKGKAITGIVYSKLPYGPVPEHYDRLLAFLYEREYAGAEFVQFSAGTEGERIVAKQDADLSVLAQQVIEAIDRVVDFFSSYSATQISDYSHRESAYINAAPGEAISYKYADDLNLE